MNWKKINKKYPLSFYLFFVWFKGDPRAHMTEKEFLKVNDIIMFGGDIRDLYDFFDVQEMFITVNPEIQNTREIDENYENPHYVIEGWYYDINDNSYWLGGSGVIYKNRIDAEKNAFLRAFEILEEILNEETGTKEPLPA